MLKRFLRPFAYVLLLLIPLQGVAAASMLVCNSVMQIQQLQQVSQAQQMQDMPCHAHVKSTAQVDNTADTHTDHGKSNSPHCKNTCTTLCAITALPAGAKTTILPNAAEHDSAADFPYVSITLPSLQRPPIFLA